ncbi:DEAD/DEAH box helicase [Mycoplasma aquilae ATCC BAA-1896]|uniref:DEAD/DEAH box helicase n=1 Tax=Mycoplasma aquilae TaxID=1312741 RepID=UPI003A8531F2
MINIKWKRFQEKTIENTTNFVLSNKDKKSLVIKSPTGSGKTLMMLQMIANVINNDVNKEFIFLWLAPGAGSLEEQSKRKMIKFYPEYDCGDVQDILNNGFVPDTTYFINWEKITKKGNKAIAEAEYYNIHDQALKARDNGYKFIVIVDEEHVNQTKKAFDFLHDHIKPFKEIRISATAKAAKGQEYIEITDKEVIDSELITRSIYINPDVNTKEALEDFENEAFILIKAAEQKRLEIVKAYESIDSQYRINPLVIVQIPNKSDSLIHYMQENLFDKMGVSVENGKLAIWLDNDKQNIEGIEKNNSAVEYLIFKQATATGWDCPRAKILVKLRDNMAENFEIQTIGRIRRMPSQRHFDDDKIDNCFLYTFDAKFKDNVLMQANGIEVARVNLKPEFNKFTLVKEERNLRTSEHDDDQWIRTSKLIYKFLKEKYKLTRDLEENAKKLADNGYIIDTKFIHDDMRQGQVQELSGMIDDVLVRKDVRYHYNTAANHNDETHAIDKLRNILGFDGKQLKNMLNTLISSRRANEYLERYQIIEIGLAKPQIFLINNVNKLASDFQEFTTQANIVNNYNLFESDEDIVRSNWYIPTKDEIVYDSTSKDKKVFTKNVYEEYDASMATTKNKIRSLPEHLFEMFCQSNKHIKWYYKNGDKGKPYLSLIIKKEGLERLQAFYPDYILEDSKGTIWIIEAKGGESFQGESKNIDPFSAQKYATLKRYEKWYNNDCESKKYNLKTAFVRDKDNTLYIRTADNYEENLNDPDWYDIKQFFNMQELNK